MGVRDVIAKTLQGIKAFHSSPHDFSKFDFTPKAIGSGEGAAAYGHGGYFAESPKVSGQGGEYWNQFRSRFEGTPEGDAAKRLRDAGFDRDAAIATSQSDLDKLLASLKGGTLHPSVAGNYSDPVLIEAINKSMYRDRAEMHDLLTSGKPVGPRTYEVNINADPATMLNWDKPLAEQPHILDVLKDRGYKDAPWPYGNRLMGPGNGLLDLKDSGADVYRALGGGGSKYNKPLASQTLFESGVPGIQYLDQGSRQTAADLLNAEQSQSHYARLDPAHRGVDAWQEQINALKAIQPTNNYVMFPGTEGLVDIAKKYAVPGAVGAGAMGATYDQSQYEAPQ